MPTMKVKLPKDLYEEIKAISQRTGRSIDAIVSEALEIWLLEADAVTGLVRSKTAPPKKTKWTCPICGSPLVTVPSKYAELGFCAVCMDVTLDPDELKVLLSEVAENE